MNNACRFFSRPRRSRKQTQTFLEAASSPEATSRCSTDTKGKYVKKEKSFLGTFGFNHLSWGQQEEKAPVKQGLHQHLKKQNRHCCQKHQNVSFSDHVNNRVTCVCCWILSFSYVCILYYSSYYEVTKKKHYSLTCFLYIISLVKEANKQLMEQNLPQLHKLMMHKWILCKKGYFYSSLSPCAFEQRRVQRKGFMNDSGHPKSLNSIQQSFRWQTLIQCDDDDSPHLGEFHTREPLALVLVSNSYRVTHHPVPLQFVDQCCQAAAGRFAFSIYHLKQAAGHPTLHYCGWGEASLNTKQTNNSSR